jgi:hypothetical protein
MTAEALYPAAKAAQQERKLEMEMRTEQTGIEPATGERARLLDELSQAALEAIKIVELERSGIRDGDGYWHADVIGGMTGDLNKLCERLMKTYDEAPAALSMTWAA